MGSATATVSVTTSTLGVATFGRAGDEVACFGYDNTASGIRGRLAPISDDAAAPVAAKFSCGATANMGHAAATPAAGVPAKATASAALAAVARAPLEEVQSKPSPPKARAPLDEVQSKASPPKVVTETTDDATLHDVRAAAWTPPKIAPSAKTKSGACTVS